MDKKSVDPKPRVCIVCDYAYDGHQQIEGGNRQSLSLSSCGRRLPTTRGSRRGDDRGMDLQLCSQLPVILFVRKILRIPSQFLESLLCDNGDPSQWGIDLCRACMGVFKKTEIIHSKIIKLIEEFEGLADKLREELRESDRRKSCKNEGGADTLPETKASRKGNKGTKGRGIQKELIRNVTDRTSASVNLRQEFLRISCETNQEIQTNVEKGSKLKTPITVGYEDFSRVGKFELEGDEDVFNSANDIMDHDDSSSPQCFEEMADSSADVQSESTETRSIPEIPPFKAKNLNGNDEDSVPNSEDVEEDSMEGGHKKESKARLDKNEDDTRGGTMKNDGSDKESSVSASPSKLSDSSEGFYCDICAKKKRRKKILYKTKDMLESHKRKVHQRMAKPCECKQCGKFFKTNYRLHRHMLGHAKKRYKRPFCEECNREFKNMNKYRLHMQTRRHRPPEPIVPKQKKKKPVDSNLYRYECLECDRKFKSKNTFNVHLAESKFHNPRLEYQCEFCSKGFRQKHSLEEHHARDHHVELNIQPIQCTVCGKRFGRKRYLDYHMGIHHTKNYLFKCTECNMGFMTEHFRDRHFTIVHAKEKQLQCTDCPKRFFSKSQLTIHMRIHTGEKPLKCKDCGKGFSDPPTFNRHREIHGDTTHICSVCGKQFKVWHSYRIHMKRHNQHVSKGFRQTVPVPEGDSSNVDSTPAPASENSAAASLL